LQSLLPVSAISKTDRSTAAFKSTNGYTVLDPGRYINTALFWTGQILVAASPFSV
jgi:hypothetical protein